MNRVRAGILVAVIGLHVGVIASAQPPGRTWSNPVDRRSWESDASRESIGATELRRQIWVRLAQLENADDEPLLDDSLLSDALSGGAHGESNDSDDDLLTPLDDDLLLPHQMSAGKDPLDDLEAAPSPAEESDSKTKQKPDPHEALWTENCYPSAETCRQCHPVQYEQWRASGHAYASVSPMFNRFEQTMTELTQGTVGSFCMRCHSPVGTQLKLPRNMSMLDAPPIVREGVTCIACHRINEHYWRSNGDRRIEPGDIHAPVYGGRGGDGVRAAISKREELKLKLSPEDKGPGQAIHREGRFFAPIKKSDICVSCHQVAVHPGIWLEVVHAQYRAGPASRRGVTCQQCHMGAIPGKPLGYDKDYVAYVGGKPFGEKRVQSNHMFWGPAFSIAHPGIFPHNPKAKQFSPREWVLFDEKSKWGTDEFEKQLQDSGIKLQFPAPWDNADDRRDGRKIIDANLARLNQKRAAAIQTMEAGLSIEGPFFKAEPKSGKDLQFHYRVTNTSEGHNLPTGSLGAQPQLWLNVALIDPDGIRVWESGYLDRRGDLADMHSVEVAEHRIPRDKHLFNLQTKFLINNVRGTDREAALPLNFSLDQLAFLRPGAVPVSVLNHPPLIRMEAHSIPPLDHRLAKYSVPAHLICKPGPYRLSVRMRSRTEPMYFMRQVKSTPAMIRRMLDNTLNLRPSSFTFWVR
ncbi:MAG: multiheme c-type cytochrome [Planctomycetota bacterium]